MKKQQGFTLIELLIVIAIIAVLAGIVFVALNPLKRFQDSRNSRRAADIQNILSAIKVDQADNGGYILTSIASTTAGAVYMIRSDSTATLCNAQNANCITDVASSTACIDLSGLVSAGKLGSIPSSPNGLGSWSNALLGGDTGYTLTRSSTGAIIVRACEAEGISELVFSR